ncbi:MAG: hypothetical protein EBW93_02315 [Betaproteobacteria bacterium]|nr:hypothetical protein [Betaproteobacteria bacterium]
MNIVLKVFFSLPLIVIHLLGCFLGLLMYLLDAKFRERTVKHISQSHVVSGKVATKNLIVLNAMHIGMALMESFSIWFASNSRIKRLIKKTKNWDHIGSFEITAQYYGLFSPIKVMYKPTKKKWINQLIYDGRNKNLVTPVNIELGGMKQILKALKNGEAVGILPDQVPPEGHGEWSNFFNQKVYTMTLVQKLHTLTKAPIIFAIGRRLKIGSGFEIELYEFKGSVTVQKINEYIENIVKTSPEQYLWNYRRYKLPKS